MGACAVMIADTTAEILQFINSSAGNFVKCIYYQILHASIFIILRDNSG